VRRGKAAWAKAESGASRASPEQSAIGIARFTGRQRYIVTLIRHCRRDLLFMKS
jgi:hypothetical protein